MSDLEASNVGQNERGNAGIGCVTLHSPVNGVDRAGEVVFLQKTIEACQSGRGLAAIPTKDCQQSSLSRCIGRDHLHMGGLLNDGVRLGIWI